MKPTPQKMKPSHRSMSPMPHLHHGGLIQGKIERKKEKRGERERKEWEIREREEDEEGDKDGRE